MFAVQNKAQVDREKLYELLLERTKKGFDDQPNSAETSITTNNFKDMKADLEQVMPTTVAQNVIDLLQKFSHIGSPRAIAVFLVNMNWIEIKM